MKNILLILITIFLISCGNNENTKVHDISNQELIQLSESINWNYRIIFSEKDKSGSYWITKIENAELLKSNIVHIINDIDNNIPVDKASLETLNFDSELIEYLPENFNDLPKNYKKLVILNIEQIELNRIVSMCLNSSFHYKWVKASIQLERDTISIGEENRARISILASNFRDCVYIYDKNDSLIFTGIDSLGYVDFSRIETTKGLKVYKGYYNGSLLKDSDLPKFEVQYFVK